MYNSNNLIILFLFAVSSAHLVNCRPVQLEGESEEAIGVKPKYVINLPADMKRVERQVVQPTWLNDKSLPVFPSDGKVVINQQNLAETAELRDAIRKAVEEGRYYVDIDQDDPPNDISTQSNTQRSISQQPRQFSSTPSSPFNPSQWYMSFQQPQQAQLFNPSSWSPSQWSMSFQPQQSGPAQAPAWNPAQWSMPFQPQQQQFQFAAPSPWNQNQQWSMQFVWPSMRTQQPPNPMQRMWTSFMQNTRRMFDNN